MVEREKIKEIVLELYRYNYWFCNGMMTYEKKDREFEKVRMESKRSEEMDIIISCAFNNAKVMKHCMEDVVRIINFLRKKENQGCLELWQIVGAEAILKQCKEEKIIPFDMPGALMAVLGMWDELEEIFTNRKV